MRYALFNEKGELLLGEQEPEKGLPTRWLDVPCGPSFKIGDVYASETDNVDIKAYNLRDLVGRLSEEDYAITSKGAELVHWSRRTRFCGRCGCKLERHGEICFQCPNCHAEYFPSPATAVLVLVKKDDKALLVHAKNFKRNFYGLVAGFVESGENLEDCCKREVMEETSLSIKNLRYVGSQCFPFPFQLMVGFEADYAGGEVKFADGELSAGGFFSRDVLPPIPRPGSLARDMIDNWIKG